MDEKIKLLGNSGCTLEVSGQRLLKSSFDPEYFERLIQQARKQQEFRGWGLFEAPNIYSVVQKQERCTVEMDFVESRSFLEVFQEQDDKYIQKFLRNLIAFLEHEIEVSYLVPVSTVIFSAKLDSLAGKVPQVFLEQGFKMLQEKGEYFTIPVGCCHGDLTLSNILFGKDRYYLVDFLDSFIDTPLQDISKVRQDTLHLWALHFVSKEAVNLERVEEVCKLFDKQFHSYFLKYRWYREYESFFDVLNLLRIFPYAKDSETEEFLVRELGKIFKV